MTRMKKPHKLSATPEIVFLSSDFEGVVPGHDDLMIILAKMVNVEVKRVFIDQGSSPTLFSKTPLISLD